MGVNRLTGTPWHTERVHITNMKKTIVRSIFLSVGGAHTAIIIGQLQRKILKEGNSKTKEKGQKRTIYTGFKHCGGARR